MPNDLVIAAGPVTYPVTAPPITLDHVDLVEMTLTGLAEQSREGYRKDLRAFARYCGSASVDAALRGLISQPRGPVNAVVAAYTADMTGRKLSPATVRRRVAAIARLFKQARRFGLTDVTPEPELPKAEAYRDTRGPGQDGWERMLDHMLDRAAGGTPKALRDLAILLLLRDRVLRRGEVSGIDYPADFDPDRPAVYVLRKRKNQKTAVTINSRTLDAIRLWVRARGDEPGPLFVQLGPSAAASPGRLSGKAINEVVRAAGKGAGLRRAVRAHGLRHQGTTEALDRGCSLRDVMQLTGHAKPDTVVIYDDRRRDVAGDLTRLLGGEGRRKKRPR